MRPLTSSETTSLCYIFHTVFKRAPDIVLHTLVSGTRLRAPKPRASVGWCVLGAAVQCEGRPVRQDFQAVWVNYLSTKGGPVQNKLERRQ